MSNQKEHRLMLDDRNRLEVSGVIHVDSFDDDAVVLETTLGMLHLKGQNLSLSNLDLEAGQVVITGLIQSFNYSEDRSAGTARGLLQRLMK